MIAAIVLLVYRRLAFTNLILARGDTFLYFYPYWEAAAGALREARLPLWNPDLFMGAPLLANSQVGFFYPLNWPVWLLFDTPTAAKASIILHVMIASFGTYLLGRRSLNLSKGGAILGAILFGLGGYLSAQVEHINQAQGMAWMPWMLLVVSNWEPAVRDWGRLAGKAVGVATFFGLQLLAGHTQTTFITGVGLGMWVAVEWGGAMVASRRLQGTGEERVSPIRRTGLILGALVLGVVLAVVLAGIQLLPTLELTGLSRRQGGLPIDEALSFSLHPLLFARALLPTYGQIPYAEYIAYVPVIGLILAVVGIGYLRFNWRVWLPLSLVILGIFLAFGKYNPLVRDYVMHVPGFALFRAPARWMVLYSLGVALLAGLGWDSIFTLRSDLSGKTARRQTERPDGEVIEREGADEVLVAYRPKWTESSIVVGIILVLLLMIGVAYSADLGLSGEIPMPPESPAQQPRFTLWLGWLSELAAAIFFLFLVLSRNGIKKQRYNAARLGLLLPIIVGLIWAQRTLTIDGLTTPEAYTDVRAGMARLMAATEDAKAQNQPPPRFLSISKGYFDPGDIGEINSIYGDQLSPEALYRYVVTTKEREIVAPNLTLSFGLSSVDGFDGGLLPLYDYAATVGLMLPEGVTTVDGRLREFLTIIPSAQWLDLFGTRFLITDRTGDNFYQSGLDNVMFDLQQRALLQPSEHLDIGYLPPYESTELWIVADGFPGSVIVDGEIVATEPVITGTVSASGVPTPTDTLYRAVWAEPFQPERITIAAAGNPTTIAGVSLVDTRDVAGVPNTFRQIVPGNYKLAHTGDVKVYENLDVLERAFVVYDWVYAPDIDSAVATLAGLDVRQMAVIEGAGENSPSRLIATEGTVVAIDSYAPEKISVSATLPQDGLLVLTEAFYPGWTVLVDGQPSEIVKTDGMFRGVFLNAGTHEVVFEYQPTSLRNGALLTLVGVILLAGLIVVSRRRATAE